MTWVILGIIVLLAVFVVGIYNGLVTARNAFKNAFAQIDVQLTRRHDLIPNLVETAKGYPTPGVAINSSSGCDNNSRSGRSRKAIGKRRSVGKTQ